MSIQEHTTAHSMFPWEAHSSYGLPYLWRRVIAALRMVCNGHSFVCSIAGGKMFFFEKDLSA